MASLGELTAGIAHEIQNPLNFVNNFSELSVELAQELKEALEKPEPNKELVSDLVGDLVQNQEKINHHGKRAANIVSGMLQHSRAGSGKKEPVDINDLADEYLRLSYHGLRAKNKEFNAKMSTDFDKSIGVLEVVPQDMGRVLLNLINNAFYAVTQRKTASKITAGETYEPLVKVSSHKTADGMVEICVADNGTGIPPAVAAKIFQPFFTTKPTGQGTGLGLSLAYDIVTKGHGGTLDVQSVEGEGTTFTIRIPIKS
jgi:signal transduction histidine kinase